MMTYQEAMDFINHIPHIGKRNGVNRVRPLLEKLGNPQQHLRFVHVAGTNGKGSTVAMTASVLHEAGLRVGMFISPYVEDFRERIQLDGQWISKEDLAEEVSILAPLFRQLQQENRAVTEFEFDTAMALHYFARKKCDMVVLEVGMGGKLDATNCIDAPDVSAIASVSFDHTQYLGNTLAEIAGEKAGIIKMGSRVAVYPKEPEEAMEVIGKVCRQHSIRPNVPDLSQLEILSCGGEGSQIRYKGKDLHIPLLGEHQIYNALTVCAIFEELNAGGWDFDWETVQKGIEKARFGGRQEVICHGPLCLVDGAHNPDGVDSLCRTIDRFFAGKQITVVMGMLEDKDYAYGLSQLAQRASRFIAATPQDTPRALPAEKAAEIARKYCEKVEAVDDPAQAAFLAKSQAGAEDVVIACGSLYMIGYAKQGFLREE